MPPKEAKTWTADVERNFLLEILKRIDVAVPASVFHDIATQWGDQHTKGSLSKKFSRMKQIFEKDTTGGGKDGAAKRKAIDDEGADDNGEAAAKAKKPKTNTKKADSVIKAESAEEEV